MTTFLHPRALIASLLLALALAPCSASRAADRVDADAPQGAAPAYACDLRRSAEVCREFTVVTDREQRLRTLSEGCASMGGTFRAGASCPRANRVARCVDVVPDPNHLDQVRHTYDVHYYADTSHGWNSRSVQRVCDNLMGSFAPE